MSILLRINKKIWYEPASKYEESLQVMEYLELLLNEYYDI